MPDIIQRLTGYNVPDSADTLVTVLVLAAAIYVIDALVKRLFPNKQTQKLAADYRAKLGELEKLTGIEAKQLDKALQEKLNERCLNEQEEK